MSKKSSSSSKKSSSSYGGNNNSSTSSTMEDLFGPKPSSSSFQHSSNTTSSSSSSSSIFGSMFGPSSMGRGRDSTNHVGNVHHVAPDHGTALNKEGAYYQQQTVDQPCYFSNSIYYGAQEVYSPTTRSGESHLSTFKKGEQDEDPDSASRGNWWQGSLYY